MERLASVWWNARMPSSRKKQSSARKAYRPDVHAEVIARSLNEATATFNRLDPEHRVDSIDREIDLVVSELEQLMIGQDPVEIVEQGRRFLLPWSARTPTYQAGVENGFALVELLAIVALKSTPHADKSSSRPSSIIERCTELAAALMELGTLRAVVTSDPNDPLDSIRVRLQSSEVAMRGSSYSELLEETSHELFDDPDVDLSLRTLLSFGVSEAVLVLTSLHEAQVANMNRRYEQGFRAVESVQQLELLGGRAEDESNAAATSLDRAFNPSSIEASISATDLVRSTKLTSEMITAVVDFFTWTPDTDGTVNGAVREFLSGNNPLRVAPIIRTESARSMIVHPALIQAAIRERLEEILRSSTHWERYQKHRGEILEQRTRRAFDKLLAPTRAWHGFLYYVPATEVERMSPPDSYTKRVEGDHLLLVDDIAFVIEDKAVALSSKSRSGSGQRLQKDLTGIITSASAQADRLVRRIQEDGGIRVHKEGWVDLSQIREIHTVAVSLDDLTSTSTATAALVESGLIPTGSVPWTVSIHDLDLIAELIAHPADFLLYLRRRRHPLATVLYTAPDELDLFLYFFEAGLYVEEDPDEVRAAFTYLDPASGSERSRWLDQVPGVVTSRTDPLDAWYFEDFARVRSGKLRLPTAPRKPRRTQTSLAALIADIDEISPYAKTSLQATLLSGNMKTQQQMARYGRDVVRRSNKGQLARSITVPVPTVQDGGWLLVWAVRPVTDDQENWNPMMRSYLRLKGHQMKLSRAALLEFDGRSGELVSVFTEAVPDQLTESDLERALTLQPPSELRTAAQLSKVVSGQRTQPRRKKRRR
jgi:hypothetical protein